MAGEEVLISYLIAGSAVVISVINSILSRNAAYKKDIKENNKEVLDMARHLAEQTKDIEHRLAILEGRQAERDKGKSAV